MLVYTSIDNGFWQFALFISHKLQDQPSRLGDLVHFISTSSLTDCPAASASTPPALSCDEPPSLASRFRRPYPTGLSVSMFQCSSCDLWVFGADRLYETGTAIEIELQSGALVRALPTLLSIAEPQSPGVSWIARIPGRWLAKR